MHKIGVHFGVLPTQIVPGAPPFLGTLPTEELQSRKCALLPMRNISRGRSNKLCNLLVLLADDLLPDCQHHCLGTISDAEFLKNAVHMNLDRALRDRE